MTPEAKRRKNQKKKQKQRQKKAALAVVENAIATSANTNDDEAIVSEPVGNTGVNTTNEDIGTSVEETMTADAKNHIGMETAAGQGQRVNDVVTATIEKNDPLEEPLMNYENNDTNNDTANNKSCEDSELIYTNDMVQDNEMGQDQKGIPLQESSVKEQYVESPATNEHNTDDATAAQEISNITGQSTEAPIADILPIEQQNIQTTVTETSIIQEKTIQECISDTAIAMEQNIPSETESSTSEENRLQSEEKNEVPESSVIDSLNNGESYDLIPPTDIVLPQKNEIAQSIVEQSTQEDKNESDMKLSHDDSSVIQENFQVEEKIPDEQEIIIDNETEIENPIFDVKQTSHDDMFGTFHDDHDPMPWETDESSKTMSVKNDEILISGGQFKQDNYNSSLENPDNELMNIEEPMINTNESHVSEDFSNTDLLAGHVQVLEDATVEESLSIVRETLPKVENERAVAITTAGTQITEDGNVVKQEDTENRDTATLFESNTDDEEIPWLNESTVTQQDEISVQSVEQVVPLTSKDNETIEAESVDIVRNSENEVKKFSFLQDDDDLLDDQDSFLESDEELSEVDQVQEQVDAPSQYLATQQPALPQQHIPQINTASKYAPVSNNQSNIQSAVLMATSQPHGTVGIVLPQQVNINDNVVQPNTVPTLTLGSSVATTGEALSMNNPLNVQKSLQHLNDEKKKSDAYDFPMGLLSEKIKPVHAKPVGVPLRKFSDAPIAPGIPKKNSRTPSMASSAQGTQHSLPVNPYASVAASENPKPYSNVNVGGVMPPKINLAVDAPPKIGSNMQYPPSNNGPPVARNRTFSNVSVPSVSSNGPSHSYPPQNVGGTLPPNNGPSAQYSGLQNNLAPQNMYSPNAMTSVENRLAPVNTNISSGVGLSSPSNLTPATGRINHARKNSSVYSPAANESASKYAPTVHPQYQQQQAPFSSKLPQQQVPYQPINNTQMLGGQSEIPQQSNVYKPKVTVQPVQPMQSTQSSMQTPLINSMNAPPSNLQNGSVKHPLTQGVNRQQQYGTATGQHNLPLQGKVSSMHTHVDNATLLSRQYPVFNWSSSNKVVYGIPTEASNYMIGVNTLNNFNVVNYDSITGQNNVLKTFPGPLSNKIKKKDVEKWICTSKKELGYEDSSDEFLIWSLLQLKLSDNHTLKDVSHLLYNSDELKVYLSQPYNALSVATASKLDLNGQMRVLASLQVGDHDGALKDALQHRDYAMALLISSLVGKDKWSEIIHTYLTEEFVDNRNDNNIWANLLSLIFQAFVGNSRKAVQRFYSNESEGNWAVENWRVIVAAILVNVVADGNSIKIPTVIMEFLVEFGIFLSQRNQKLSAAVLFMIAGIPLSTVPVMKDSDVFFTHVGNASTSQSILWSELYEYICCLDNAKISHFEILLPQKIYHGYCLEEQGSPMLASKYADYVNSKLKHKKDNITLNLATKVEELNNRIAETGTSWLTKPKLSSVWGHLDKSFNKYIGGDDDEPHMSPYKKVFDNFTPSNSNNSSIADFTQQTGFTPYKVNTERSTAELKETATFNRRESRHSQDHTSQINDFMYGVPNVSHTNDYLPQKPGSVAMKQSLSRSSYAPPIRREPSISDTSDIMKNSSPGIIPPINATSLNQHTVHPPSSAPPVSILSNTVSPVTSVPNVLSSTVKNVDTKPTVIQPPIPQKTYKRPVEAIKNNDVGYTPEIMAKPSVEKIQGPYMQMSQTTASGSQANNIYGSDTEKIDQLSSVHDKLISATLEEKTDSPPHLNNTASSESVDSSDLTSTQNTDVKQPSTLSDMNETGFEATTSIVPVVTENIYNNLADEQIHDKSSNQTEVAGVEIKDIPVEIQQELSNEAMGDAEAIIKDESENAEEESMEIGKKTHEEEIRQENESKSNKISIETDFEKHPSDPLNKQSSIEVSSNTEEDSDSINLAHDISTGHSTRPIENVISPQAESITKTEIGVHSHQAKIDDAIGLGITSPDKNNKYPAPPKNVNIPVNPYSPMVDTNKKPKRRTAYVPTSANYSVPAISEPQDSSVSINDIYQSMGNNSLPGNLDEIHIESRTPSEDVGKYQRPEEPLSMHDETFEPIIKPANNFESVTSVRTFDDTNTEYNDIVEEESDDEDAVVTTESPKVPKKKIKEKVSTKENDKATNKSGWFGWLKKDPNEKKAVKAKLGHQNNFYYDEKLKRWINKDATEEEKKSLAEAAAPPPPPVIKRKDTTIKTKPRQSIGHHSKPSAGTPLPATVLPTNPLTGKPMSLQSVPIPSAKNDSDECATTNDSNSDTNNSKPPPSQPPVNLAGKKTNGLDDILNISGTAAGRRKKKSKSSRGYVNVMDNLS